MDERDVVKAATLAASEAIAKMLDGITNSGEVVLDEEGNEVPMQVVAIIAATTLAALYGVQSGLNKERFLLGMEATFEHMEETVAKVEEILKDLPLVTDTGENKWVQ